MNNPILDQIENGMDNGIMLIVIVAIIIALIAYIVKAIKNRKIEEIESSNSTSSKDNFFYNRIEEDITNLDINLSDEAKNLISTYRD